jgi:hypothetical protein
LGHEAQGSKSNLFGIKGSMRKSEALDDPNDPLLDLPNQELSPEKQSLGQLLDDQLRQHEVRAKTLLEEKKARRLVLRIK